MGRREPAHLFILTCSKWPSLFLLNYSPGINGIARLTDPDKVNSLCVVGHIEFGRFAFALDDAPHDSLPDFVVHLHYGALRCVAHIGNARAGIGVYRNSIICTRLRLPVGAGPGSGRCRTGINGYSNLPNAPAVVSVVARHIIRGCRRGAHRNAGPALLRTPGIYICAARRQRGRRAGANTSRGGSGSNRWRWTDGNRDTGCSRATSAIIAGYGVRGLLSRTHRNAGRGFSRTP
jgi:hypothetical protein